LRTDLVHDPYGEADGLSRILTPDHQLVTDRFDALCSVFGEELADRIEEVEREFRSLLVPVGLGEGRKPGKVREQEGVGLGWGRLAECHPTNLQVVGTG